MNGNLNGSEHFLGPRRLIDRSEFVRILEQALVHLGYADIAAELERASGIVLQPPTATAFREAILNGDYSVAINLLPNLGSSSASIHHARFLILRHKYFEAVAAGDSKSALHCLRHELQPLQNENNGVEMLHGLTSLLVSHGNCSTPSRETLLAELQSLLPPSLLIPEARLEELVEQALLAQLERCPYHNSRGLRMSLFTDYVAGPEQLPTELSQTLDAHADEVWALQFSGDGKWMASASKDGSALLWSVTDGGIVSLERAVVQDIGPLSVVSFSPDNTHLAVGGSDGKLRIYTVPSGALELEVTGAGTEGLAAVSWLPDSRKILIIQSRELRIIDVSSGGNIIERIVLGQHTYDALLSHDGGTVVTVGQDRRLRFLRLSDRREVFLGPEPASVTCLSSSPDGRFFASNMNNGLIHVWPLGDLRASEADFPTHHRPGGTDPLDALPAVPLQTFRVSEGQNGRYVIRSTFGGAGYSFLASGSEGGLGTVHIWHRESGEMLATLEGHTNTVNCVTWNPRNQYMLASCSDDHSIKVWLAPELLGRSR